MHLTFFGLPSGFTDTPLTQRGLPLLTLDKFSTSKRFKEPFVAINIDDEDNNSNKMNKIN